MKPAGLILAALLVGCGSPPPAQRGGSGQTTLAGLTSPPTTGATLTQGENAAGASLQSLERTETRQTAAPVPVMKVTETPSPSGPVVVTEHFAPPAVLTSTVTEKASTALGPAQKDTGREIAASLAGMKPVQFAGIGFLAFALSCFHPVIRRVTGGGKVFPAAAAGLGLVLCFGPQLFAGRETLALVGAVVALILVFLGVRAVYSEGRRDERGALDRHAET